MEKIIAGMIIPEGASPIQAEMMAGMPIKGDELVKIAGLDPRLIVGLEGMTIPPRADPRQAVEMIRMRAESREIVLGSPF